MIGYLDCTTGVSGDKLLGSLLQIGERTGRFTAGHLGRLVRSLAPEVHVSVEVVRSHGITATSVRVVAREEPPSRDWARVRELINAAEMTGSVRARVLETFEALAQAEAEAHGVPVDKVHFHEVGAIDSIADVVGVCAGLAALEVERLTATPVAVGAGVVEASHGALPVPAPATAALLLGIPTTAGPTRSDGRPIGELTTPTGAALLKVLVSEFGPWPSMVPRLIGYGAGTRDITLPNVCRLVVGEAAVTRVDLAPEAVSVLESNVDHLSPEATAVVVEQLLEAGALDAWTSPVVMKKGRSAVVLAALVPQSDAVRFAERIVGLTGTLGVRRLDQERLVAPREQSVAETDYGPVRYKVGPTGPRPEADDVARIARELSRGYVEVERELRDLLG